MNKILILGAGRSSNYLIDYLAKQAETEGWKITLCDLDEGLAKAKAAPYPAVTSRMLDTQNTEELIAEIENATLVISMLPPFLHFKIAKICIEKSSNFATASYLSDEIRALNEEAKYKDLNFVMECGLDPGLDHMSAMQVIDDLKQKGLKLTAFETFTGGLLATENEDNPWNYKFTWNPRNVVLAGQGVVKFIQQGRFKYIPYHRLFKRTEMIHIPKHGYFEGYANRDSLKYLDVYNLHGIKTLYRGTLRRPGFCDTWNIFIQLGATDDSYQMEDVSNMTHRQFINSFLSYNPFDSVELKLAHYANIGMESREMYMLNWLGMFSDELVGLQNGSPAQVLEYILRKKWTMNDADQDMIVMWHKFGYEDEGEEKWLHSHMIVKGEGGEKTAMAKTVGLPLAIVCEMIMKKEIKTKGVMVPIAAEIYEPTLQKLKKFNLYFETYTPKS
ncbi:MAG: saccharopine dehydrogenase family protein [Cyclobacteriaceae bacterium]